MKPRIHQFTNLKCCKKAREPFKTLFNGILFLIYYFKKHFQRYFFILKALKDILQHFEFMNWWIRGFVFLMSRAGYLWLQNASHLFIIYDVAWMYVSIHTIQKSKIWTRQYMSPNFWYHGVIKHLKNLRPTLRGRP